MCFTFCTSQCVYISYVHIDIQVGHIIRIACITGAFPTHIPTYISSGARRILLCNESQYLLGFSQLYKYTTWYMYTLYVYTVYIYISTWFAFCNRYGIHNKWAIGHCLKTMNFFPRRIWLALEWPRWLWTWGWVPLPTSRPFLMEAMDVGRRNWR